MAQHKQTDYSSLLDSKLFDMAWLVALCLLAQRQQALLLLTALNNSNEILTCCRQGRELEKKCRLSYKTESNRRRLGVNSLLVIDR